MDNRLIIALDVFEETKALEIAKNISDMVFAVKINWPLILGAGPGIISKLSRFTPVICDLKIADIPNTNSLITQKVHQMGAYGVIAHAFVGGDSLRAVVESARGIKVLAVVAMSHPGASDFMEKDLDGLLSLALKSGVDGFIAPGNNPSMIRRVREKSMNKPIVSPGIGAQGGNAVEAVMNGTDYVIVGRSVYESANPEQVVGELNWQISEGLERRPGRYEILNL